MQGRHRSTRNSCPVPASNRTDIAATKAASRPPFLMRALLLLAGLTGLFLGWNMPNHYPPWPTFHGELAAALGICLLFLGLLWPAPVVPAAAGAAAAVSLPIPLAARAWLMAGLVPVVQYVAGGLTYRGDALIGLLYGLGAALGLYAGALWAAQEGSARVLKLVFGCIALSGVAAAGIALTQWLGLGTRRLVVDGADRKPALRQPGADQPFRAADGAQRDCSHRTVRDSRAEPSSQLLPGRGAVRLDAAGLPVARRAGRDGRGDSAVGRHAPACADAASRCRGAGPIRARVAPLLLWPRRDRARALPRRTGHAPVARGRTACADLAPVLGRGRAPTLARLRLRPGRARADRSRRAGPARVQQHLRAQLRARPDDLVRHPAGDRHDRGTGLVVARLVQARSASRRRWPSATGCSRSGSPS